MTQYLPQLLTVALIHLLALMSPGPDFVMTLRNAFKYSPRTSVFSSIGLGLGIAVHVFYSIVGIGLIVSKSVIAFSVIKFLGAGYLMFIGWKSLTAKPSTSNDQIEKVDDISPIEAVRMGFLTNVLNPKATVFFVSLFSQFISPSTPVLVKALFGVEMVIATMVWFSFVGLVAAHPQIKNRLTKSQTYIERFTGMVLILFGVKLALSKR